MPKKVFRIGECAVGGVIVAEIKGEKLTLICKQWDVSGGYTRKASQANAKEIYRKEIDSSLNNSYWSAYNTLSDWTTHYWANTILEWVKNNRLELKRGW